jgi:hypothetical protein
MKSDVIKLMARPIVFQTVRHHHPDATRVVMDGILARPVAVADLTVQDFSEGLGWLIINSQARGVSIEDQIVVMQTALDALREAFS